jgi:hypothetical protein
VRITAEITIGTLLSRIRIVKTKIFLVFLCMVMLLHRRMGVHTPVTFWTFLLLLDVRTQISRIEVTIAFTILGRVVVYALFVVVVFGDVTGRYFEDLQIEVLTHSRSTLTLEGAWNW